MPPTPGLLQTTTILFVGIRYTWVHLGCILLFCTQYPWVRRRCILSFCVQCQRAPTDAWEPVPSQLGVGNMTVASRH